MVFSLWGLCFSFLRSPPLWFFGHFLSLRQVEFRKKRNWFEQGRTPALPLGSASNACGLPPAPIENKEQVRQRAASGGWRAPQRDNLTRETINVSRPSTLSPPPPPSLSPPFGLEPPRGKVLNRVPISRALSLFRSGETCSDARKLSISTISPQNFGAKP